MKKEEHTKSTKKSTYNTYLIIGVIALAILGTTVTSLTSTDLDSICNLNNKYLERLNGNWTCANPPNNGIDGNNGTGVNITSIENRNGYLTFNLSNGKEINTT